MDVKTVERELKIITSCLESEEFEMAQEHLVELLQDFYDLPPSEQSVQLLQQTLQLPYWLETGYEAGEMELLSHLVEHLGHLRQYTEARRHALRLAEKIDQVQASADKDFISMCRVTACFWIAYAYQKEDDYENAAEYFRKLLGIEVVAAEKAMNYEMRLVSMLNLGICYDRLGDPERAARYLNLLLRYKDVYANPNRASYDQTVAGLISQAEEMLEAFNTPPPLSAEA